MTVAYSKGFLKEYKKLPQSVQEKFHQRLKLFVQDASHPLLRDHSVDLAYPGWRSINVTGDYRVLYQGVGDTVMMFMKIGTHSELYG